MPHHAAADEVGRRRDGEEAERDARGDVAHGEREVVAVEHRQHLDLHGRERRQRAADAGAEERPPVGGERQALLQARRRVAEQERAGEVDEERRPRPRIARVREPLADLGARDRAEHAAGEDGRQLARVGAHSAHRRGAAQQQRPLARVARERRGALELGARLVVAAELARAGRRARSAAGGSRASDGSSTQRVDQLEPGRGAERHRRRATARFSSTTGDGATCAERVVERGDARPVGLLGGAGARVAGGDRGLQRVRARRAAEPLGALERGQPAADQQLVPARAVLVEQQDRLARRADARAQRATPGSPSAPPGRAPRARSGTSSARMRPSRSASSHSAGRIQSSPAVAE